MESLDPDQRAYQRLLGLKQPLVEAIWRHVIYGETLDDILGKLSETSVIDDTELGYETRELISGTYRFIVRVEAEERASKAN